MTRAVRRRTAALHMKWPLQTWLWKFPFGRYGGNFPFPLLRRRDGVLWSGMFCQEAPFLTARLVSSNVFFRHTTVLGSKYTGLSLCFSPASNEEKHWSISSGCVGMQRAQCFLLLAGNGIFFPFWLCRELLSSLCCARWWQQHLQREEVWTVQPLKGILRQSRQLRWAAGHHLPQENSVSAFRCLLFLCRA